MFSTSTEENNVATFNPCCIVPVYNNDSTVSDLVKGVLAQNIPCLVVNDGSNDRTRSTVETIKSNFSKLLIINHDRNYGKGAAITTGIREAFKHGFTHAVTIDADGQHDYRDLPKFISAAQANPKALICGQPIFDRSIPSLRLYGRRISIWLSRLETLSTNIADILCGYRVYPLESSLALIEKNYLGNRMAFESAIAIRLYWSGVPIRNVATKVSYPKNGISHFAMWHDNFRLILLHLRLIALLPLYIPTLLSLKFQHTDTTHWFSTPESGNSFAIWLGATILKKVGRDAFSILFYPIITYFFLTASKYRAGSRIYLTQLFSTERGRQSLNRVPDGCMVYAHFVQFGQMIIDRVLTWGNFISLDSLEWKGIEELMPLVERQQGGIFISAHFGSLEVVRTLTEKIPGLKVNALMQRNFAAKLGAIRDSAGAGNRLVDVQDFSPATVLKLREFVDRGEFVALLGDRVAVSTPDRSRPARFLGKDAYFPEGPWIMAALLECPVFLVFCVRLANNNYRVYFEKFTNQVTLPRGNRGEALQAYIKQYARRLEEHCFNAPLQWFNLHDFWHANKTSPAPDEN